MKILDITKTLIILNIFNIAILYAQNPTSGNYLGHSWHIDSDHKLIWDGEPYIPYSFTGTGMGNTQIDAITWFQSNGFDKMSLNIPENIWYQTESELQQSVAEFDSITTAVTQAGLTYSAGLNFLLPPIERVDSTEAVEYILRHKVDVTQLAGSTTDLTVEMGTWIRNYWFEGEAMCWLFNFTDETATEIPESSLTVTFHSEEDKYFTVELNSVSFPTSNNLILFIGIKVKTRCLAIGFENGGSYSVPLQTGAFPPLWQPGVKSLYQNMLNTFANAYRKEGLRTLMFGDEINIFEVDFLMSVYPAFNNDTVAMNDYHNWLEQRYGTISAFNDSMSTTYANFSDIPWYLPINPFVTLDDSPDSITHTFGFFNSLAQEFAFEALQSEFRMHLLGKCFAEYGQMAKDAVGDVSVFTTIPGGTFQFSFLSLHRACLEEGIDGLNYNPYGTVIGTDLFWGEMRIELENFLQTVNDAEQMGGYTKLLWVNEFHHIQGGGDEAYWEFPSEQVMREFLNILVNNGVRGFHFFLMEPGDPAFTEQVGWYANLKNEIIGLITNVNVEEGTTGLPKYFKLEQNCPNPFNPVTAISFQLPNPSLVKLSIYNLVGQLIETLLKEKMNAGYHTVAWNAKGVGSGVYFYKIEADNYSAVKKCIILK